MELFLNSIVGSTAPKTMKVKAGMDLPEVLLFNGGGDHRIYSGLLGSTR